MWLDEWRWLVSGSRGFELVPHFKGNDYGTEISNYQLVDATKAYYINIKSGGRDYFQVTENVKK